MQQPTEPVSDEGNGSRSSSSSTPYTGSNAPLVIVSERGRHSNESRRIVRAQAARASAAQSRVTRARNRGEREGALREGLGSPGAGDPSQGLDSSPRDDTSGLAADFTRKPLVIWLSSVLNTSPTSLVENAQALTTSSLAGIGNISPVSRGAMTTLGPVLGLGPPGSEYRPQLPAAVPRGIITLQQRIHVSENIIALMSRTSCFDFDSPGVEERLHQLLFDLIIGYTVGNPSTVPPPGHAIQGYLRVACTCLTIFQGQRADGAVFAHQEKYERGLEAAWSEVMLLDRDALQDSKSAEASLWALFIISVTTGSTAELFFQLLRELFEDLQLYSWPQVRNTLLDFIFPVSFLDKPCKAFYDAIQHQGIESS